jgi:hypothetical protein
MKQISAEALPLLVMGVGSFKGLKVVPAYEPCRAVTAKLDPIFA